MAREMMTKENDMDELFKQHLRDASIHEKVYLKKEPTGATANSLLKMMADCNLSVAEIKGCLDFAKHLADFQGKIPTQK